MKPAFVRIGGKTLLKKHILPLIPNTEIYVEPFIGGGAIYLGKEPCEKEIINDLDENLIKGWEELKKETNEDLTIYDTNDLTELTKLYKSDATNGIAFLVKQLITARNTYSCVGRGKLYKTHSPYITLKNKKQYEERLKNTTILNEDYKSVITKYDSENTFFYLDPPYNNSKKLYKHGEFNNKELNDILINLKGMFLLSLNDSEEVRETFKNFKIIPIENISSTNLNNKGKIVKRKEVLIFNYDLGDL